MTVVTWDIHVELNASQTAIRGRSSADSIRHVGSGCVICELVSINQRLVHSTLDILVILGSLPESRQVSSQDANGESVINQVMPGTRIE